MAWRRHTASKQKPFPLVKALVNPHLRPTKVPLGDRVAEVAGGCHVKAEAAKPEAGKPVEKHAKAKGHEHKGEKHEKAEMKAEAKPAAPPAVAPTAK